MASATLAAQDQNPLSPLKRVGPEIEAHTTLSRNGYMAIGDTDQRGLPTAASMTDNVLAMSSHQ